MKPALVLGVALLAAFGVNFYLFLGAAFIMALWVGACPLAPEWHPADEAGPGPE